MKCEEVKINLPKFIDGKIDNTISREIEGHLQTCENCRELYTELNSFLKFADSFPEINPPVGMKEEFMKQVELEFDSGKIKKIKFPGWAKVAAMVFIALGTYSIGHITGSKTVEVSQLNAELSQLKQEVLLAGLRNYSGPQKIEAVYNVKNYGETDDQLIDALVYTMNSDNNVNVRLAAINALSGMINKNERIKTELIHSLSVQDNPLLQISLIQVLTESGVKEAKDKIESILQDENINPEVKNYAKDMIKTII